MQYRGYLQWSSDYVRRRLRYSVGLPEWQALSEEVRADRVRSMIANGRKQARSRIKRKYRVPDFEPGGQ